MHDEIMLLILKKLREMEEKITKLQIAMVETADMVVTLAQVICEQESCLDEEEDPEIEALLGSVADDPERN